MRKFLTYALIFVVVVVAVTIIIKAIQEETVGTNKNTIGNNGERGTYPNSSSCQPCSSVNIKEQVNEIIESPNVKSFRGGRSVNLADACIKIQLRPNHSNLLDE